MTNHANGHRAERVAARYLQARGYKVYALNWRHRRAEIDIVGADPAGVLMFTEVKYRQTTNQGGGLDYVTPRKLGQMRFAAELWMAQHDYQGGYNLAAVELSGPDYDVTAFVPELS